MRILVIDDSIPNLSAARKTLREHAVDICEDADKAQEMLYLGRRDEVLYKQILTERGFPDGAPDWNDDTYSAYSEARDHAEKAAQLPYWEVVLCDLLMPPPLYDCQNVRSQFAGKEMVVGWAFAMQATLHGAKYSAVVTNLNHHQHPGSALLDPLLSTTDDPPKFEVNRAIVGFYSNVGMIAVSDKPCRVCANDEPYYRCPGCHGSRKESGKDWGKILEHLTRRGAEK